MILLSSPFETLFSSSCLSSLITFPSTLILSFTHSNTSHLTWFHLITFILHFSSSLSTLVLNSLISFSFFFYPFFLLLFLSSIILFYISMISRICTVSHVDISTSSSWCYPSFFPCFFHYLL